jgi:hypothetical protein
MGMALYISTHANHSTPSHSLFCVFRPCRSARLDNFESLRMSNELGESSAVVKEAGCIRTVLRGGSYALGVSAHILCTLILGRYLRYVDRYST